MGRLIQLLIQVGSNLLVIMKFSMVLAFTLICLTIVEGTFFKTNKKDKNNKRKKGGSRGSCGTRCHTVNEYRTEQSCHSEHYESCHTEYKTHVETSYVNDCHDVVTKNCSPQAHHTSHGSYHKRDADHSYGSSCHETVRTECTKRPQRHETQVPSKVCHPKSRQVCSPHSVSVPRQVCRRYCH